MEGDIIKLNMTIDEAIKMYKKIVNTDENCPRYCMRPCEDCVQQCRKIAEWLKELKALRLERVLPTTNEIIASKVGYEKGYNKAIDDFSHLLHKSFDETNIKEYGFYPNNLVKEIAEQLKAGVKHEY